MKRTAGKLLAIILTLALVFGTQSFVFAADTDYGLIFDVTEEKFFLDDGANTEYLGQDTNWSWDASTSTLTLTDFQWTTSAAYALKIDDDITLDLVGSSSFISTYNDTGYTAGINAYDLVITGDGALFAQGGETTTANDESDGIMAAALTINSGAVVATGGIGYYSAGIHCNEFTITGGSLEAIGGTASNESNGIYANEDVTISGGDLIATAGSSLRSKGVFTNTDIMISGGTMTAIGETGAFAQAPATLPTAYSWWADNAFSFTPSGLGTNSTDAAYVWNAAQQFVKIRPEVSLDEFALFFDVLTGKFYYDIDGDVDPINSNNIAYTEQTAKWSWNGGVLTLDGFTYSSKAFSALIIVGGDLTIDLKGVNTFEVPEVPGDGTSRGILMYSGDLTIKGNGTLNATGGSSSIYTDVVSIGIETNGSMLKVESGTVNATGGDVEGSSYGITSNDILLTGGFVNAKGGTTEGVSCGLQSYGILTVNDGTLQATGGAGGFASSGIEVASDFKISGGKVNAVSGTSNDVSYGVMLVGDLTISGGTLEATAGTATNESYGVFCDGGTLAITGSTLIASGHTSALNKAPDVSALSSYTYWTNTAVTAPSGNGTKFPSTAYSWSASQKYVKITTASSSTNNTPKTGDSNNILVLSVSMLLSILAILSIAVWKKQQMVEK